MLAASVMFLCFFNSPSGKSSVELITHYGLDLVVLPFKDPKFGPHAKTSSAELDPYFRIRAGDSVENVSTKSCTSDMKNLHFIFYIFLMKEVTNIVSVPIG